MSSATEERLAAARRRAGAATAAKNKGKSVDSYVRRVNIRQELMNEAAERARMGRPSARIKAVNE